MSNSGWQEEYYFCQLSYYLKGKENGDEDKQNDRG